MDKMSIEELMELLEHSAAVEFCNEYFGPIPKYTWEEVKAEIVRRLKGAK